MLGPLAEYLKSNFQQDKSRVILWYPALLALGIALYFALPLEAQPAALYSNEEILLEAGIIIISVDEEDMEQWNAGAIADRRGKKKSDYPELNGILWYSMHGVKETFPNFRSRERALADHRLKKLSCPICGKTLKVRHFTEIDEKNQAAELQTRHGLLSVRLKIMQTQKKAYYIKRTVRFV